MGDAYEDGWEHAAANSYGSWLAALAAIRRKRMDWPTGKYGAILADPPWGFQTWSGPEKKIASRGTVAPYGTMEMNDIAALPISDLTSDDCCLFLWVVWPTIPEALAVMRAWGFEYKTCAFAWMKADVSTINLFDDPIDAYMGLGYWTRANSEVCLLGTRGKPKRLNADVRQGIIAPRREHSRKPDGIHERIERLVAGPYIELFARQQRPNWTTWGNETNKFKADPPSARRPAAG
jgi:N6-adenosine-specific RNA methylase IME4